MSNLSGFTFADLSPCVFCTTKECGFVDGNECDICKYFLKVKSKLESIDREEQEILKLFEVIKSNTCKCDICGKIIFPKIITAGDGRFDVIVNLASIRGGVGNEVLHDKVCSNCMNEVLKL